MNVKTVRKKLSEIIDPEVGINIVEMGLVQQIKIDEKNKTITVTFKPTSPFCPITGYFADRIKAAINELGYRCEVKMVL